MKKLLLTGITTLFLATGTTHTSIFRGKRGRRALERR
jgi:hypothetical protein